MADREMTDGPLLAKQRAEQLHSYASKNFGGLWKFVFFIGAIAVTFSGVFGIIQALGMLLSPFSMCNQFFLAIFGLIMVIIDFPIEGRTIVEMKMSIFKYLLFMTRFTGRGFWYLYLATMIWASLYNLDLGPFLGVLLAAGVGTLGVLSIIYGISKSLKLERCRKAICGQGLQSIQTLCPPAGLHIKEFNQLCKSHAKQEFSSEELGYVASALSYQVRADDMISQDEFRAWTQGRMTIL